MLRRTVLAALATGAIVTSLPRAAEALVTYTLVNQVYGFRPAPGGPFFTAPDLNFSLSISDAAVARGAFSLRGGGAGQLGNMGSFSGDVADFVTATFTNSDTPAEIVTPARIRGTLAADFTFDLSGAVLTSSLTFLGDDITVRLGGSGSAFGGTYGTARSQCTGPGGACSVSGQFVASIPEPMSLALLGMGLLGMAVVRRRA